MDHAADHSLAAIVGFIELTRTGQIISNQTYKPSLVFGLVGLLCFLMYWPLSHRGRRTELKLAKDARRALLSAGVKGHPSPPSNPGAGHRQGGRSVRHHGHVPRAREIAAIIPPQAANQALLSGQVDAVGGNQLYISRLEDAKPGVHVNHLKLTALCNGVGTRPGEADWNESVNAFLDEFMKTYEYKAIYNKRMHMDPPQFPAEMDGVPFTARN